MFDMICEYKTHMDKTAQTEHRNANYVLGVLFVVMMLNFIDRQIVSILAESIKRDMGLSDKQIGLMTGLSFAIFYTTLSMPVAILADRWNRSRIISISVGVWSIMTMLCGAAANFSQLFLARVGVGIGEAGSSPASHSLIADLYPPERRATALGVFAISVSMGSFIAYTGGGWMAENIGWRAAFLIAGIPGILVAVIMWFTVRDPRGNTSLAQAFKPIDGEVTLREAIKDLSSKPAYWHLVAAGSALSFVAYGAQSFYAPFFVRVHGIGYEELGLKLGLMVLLFGVTGSWLGGRFGDYLNSRQPGDSLLATAVMLLISVPGFYFAIYANSVNLAMILLGIPTLAFTFFYGPCFSSIQLLASDRTRALAIAIFIFFSGLIGLGLGPLFVGALSDFFAAGVPAAEGPGLQKAIVTISLFNILAAFHFWLAQTNLKKDFPQSH